jgi:hypothetical protein
VPYLKFSRDKRGYEHFAIVEPGVPRRGKPARSRVLYMFRTPPQVKVGRMPFTDEVRRALEAQYPNVRFDWPRLMATPIPPPDADHWRERRRAEKAARQAARESEVADEPEENGAPAPDASVAADPPEESQPISAAVAEEPGEDEDEEGEDGEADDETAAAGEASESQGIGASPPAAGPDAARPPGRRRRRRGRRRPQTAVPGTEPSAPAPPDRSTDEV